MTKEELKNRAKEFVSKIASGTPQEMDYYAHILVEFATETTKELKKENTELKDKLNNLASVADVRLGMWQKYEKENAELKEKCETLEDMLDEGISYQKAKDYDGVVTSVLEQNHQLTKAISLINRLSEYIVLSEDYWKKEDVEKQKEILREAEQFLKVVSE